MKSESRSLSKDQIKRRIKQEAPNIAGPHRSKTIEHIKNFVEEKGREPYYIKIDNEYKKMNSNMKNCLKYLDPKIKKNPEKFTNPIRNIKSYANEHI
jgi:hypothetical protein